MQRLLFLPLLLALAQPNDLFAQTSPNPDGSITIKAAPPAQLPNTATIHFSIAHTRATSCDLFEPNRALWTDLLKKGDQSVPLDSNGSGTYTLKVDRPAFVYLYYAKADSNARSHIYTLFLMPGDDLYFQADMERPDDAIRVSGEGSNDNQPLIGTTDAFPDDYIYEGDTLPNRIVQSIKLRTGKYDSTFAAYIQLYHPSPEFVDGWTKNFEYKAPREYYGFKENNKFRIRSAYDRNFSTWQKAQDSLFGGLNIDNGDALIAPSYTFLLSEFLLRTKEALWKESSEHPAEFYRTWYDTTVDEGKKLFAEDNLNLLQEKIVNHYFKNPGVQDYLYSLVLEGALSSSDPTNVVPIYHRYKERFPKSQYAPWFAPEVAAIAERQQVGLSNKIVFAPDSGANLHSLEDLLALVKGKTVLLDMWGTWCGPCRQELDKNSAAIRAHFAGKGLDFVYVSNYDEEAETKWKQLIAYFNLEGTHILAQKDLTQDIMKKVKGTGYPTYVIIKKDGSFELSNAGYPMNRDVLIRQLEKALAETN